MARLTASVSNKGTYILIQKWQMKSRFIYRKFDLGIIDTYLQARKMIRLSQCSSFEDYIIISFDGIIYNVLVRSILANDVLSPKVEMCKKDAFIKRANRVHNFKYKYDNVTFDNIYETKEKVSILCSIHGIFEQHYRDHLRGYGCKECGKEKIINSKKNSFNESAIKIHGDKYNYSKVNYIGLNNKVTIICKYHGEFEQTPAIHLGGSNCPKCSQSVPKRGWTLTEYIQLCGDSNSNLYLLKCCKGDEEFLKIGMTKNTLHDRYVRTRMPYNYELLEFKSLLPEQVFKLEHEIIKENSQYKYYPNIKFTGHTECFTIDALDLITKRIKEYGN